MTTVLVWILIVGYEGGHVPAVQMGPFADLASCQRALAVEPLKRYDKQCVQVSMPVGVKA